MKRIFFLLFVLGMSATVYAQGFVEGSLYYGYQAISIWQTTWGTTPPGIDPNGRYVYRGGNLQREDCLNCPTPAPAPQPYYPPAPTPTPAPQPYYPPAPQASIQYVIVQEKRDGAAKFRDVGVGLGSMGVGTGSVLMGTAAVQGKLQPVYSYTNNSYYTGGGNSGGPQMWDPIGPGNNSGTGGGVFVDDDPHWTPGSGTGTGTTGTSGGGPNMYGTIYGYYGN